MKKIVKSLCIVLLLAFVFTASNHVNEVKAATKSEVTYKLKKGTLTISGKGDMPKKMTFERNGKIKKVVIEDGITSISKHSFSFCKNLKTVVIGKDVRKIGNGAFSYTKITSVKIPNKVKVIGAGAFENCKELKKVKIGTKVNTIDVRAFAECRKITKVKIPNSVKIIGRGAFFRCKKLKSVKLGKKVKFIGSTAFQTTAIKKIKIPNSVKVMGLAAFNSNKIKINVIMPGNVTSQINYNVAIYDAGKITFTTNLNIELMQHLEAKNFEVSKNDPNYTTIDGNIYTKNGRTLVRVPALKKNVRIADGCENICTSAFRYTTIDRKNWEAQLNKNIDKLFIPKTVKTIDENSYITYGNEIKIDEKERNIVEKRAVAINNIEIENKNFDVEILSKLLDQVTCNKGEVLKQLVTK